MPRTFYTIDDLFQFCKTNNFAKFNAKDHENKPLIIQSFETFEAEDNSVDGLLPVKLKACHIGKNRNQSFISKDNMERCMSSFKGRPILGAIHKTDTGEYEFHSHDIDVVEDGDELDIKYIEQPIGVISEIQEPYLEYDKKEDKTFLMANGNIFEDYSKAAEIMRRRKTCKCSVEIAIYELSWDGKEECLSIEDFSFRGVTILGYEQDGVTEIEEGMKGSKITIEDFSEKTNSMFSSKCEERLLETLEKLNDTISMFTINNSTKEGVNESMSHFEELLEKYNVTSEDVTFEIEGLSDEDLDALFEEKFGSNQFDDTSDDSDSDDENSDADDEVSTDEEDSDVGDEVDEQSEEVEVVDEIDKVEEVSTDDNEGNKKEYSANEDKMVLTYELSHDDIRYGLYNLLNAETNYAWIVAVYDNNFIYEDWDDSKFYRRSYSIESDNISLGEEKVQVFSEWLTQAEREALDALKQSYEALKEFKDQFDAAEQKAAKDAIFNRKEFGVIAENEKFIELKNNSEKFSVEEIEEKCKTIFADHVIANGQFALNKESNTNKTNKIGFNFSKPNKKKAYGDLFND